MDVGGVGGALTYALDETGAVHFALRDTDEHRGADGKMFVVFVRDGHDAKPELWKVGSEVMAFTGTVWRGDFAVGRLVWV